MRALALAVLCLGGCSSVGGPLDAFLPDELTLGQGSATSLMSGGLDTHWSHEEWPVDMEGETDSTYAALTWDIPSYEGTDGGMNRDTQRKLGLLIDQMVGEEIAEEVPTMGMALREGAPTPPWWLPYVFGGGILLFLVFMGLKSRSNGWH